MANNTYTLTLSCPDRRGIVYSITKNLFEHDANIVEAAQYNDSHTGLFFMRVCFDAAPQQATKISQVFTEMAKTLTMTWHIVANNEKVKTLIMVSKQGHCLNDLLFRFSNRRLPVDIKAVVSNHRDFYQLCASYNIPFHYLPVLPDDKQKAEARLWEIVCQENIELIVLARYMQILSTEFCAKMPGQIINIHHSFLPSFKGAKPYYQAHAKGVKLIGATAHYVTPDLDEGPIIEQDVQRVEHSLSIDDFTEIGKEVESRVLAHAVKWHAERRILLNGNKTVVFK